MIYPAKTTQQILLKDLIIRTLVALEGSHVHNLTPEDVAEVFKSIKDKENEPEVTALLDSLATYYQSFLEDYPALEDCSEYEEMQAMDSYIEAMQDPNSEENKSSNAS